MKRIIRHLILSSIFILGGLSTSEAVLWNHVVATYDQTVVTLWEVEREMMVSQILKQPEPVDANQVFTISEEQMKEFIKDYLVERIILDEAHGFQMDTLSAVHQDGRLTAFQNKFKRKKYYEIFLKKELWTESDLKNSLSRSMIVESFVKQKILSAFIYISDDEVKAIQRNNPAYSPDDARQFLRKSKLKENLKDWINALKRKHQVQLIQE